MYLQGWEQAEIAAKLNASEDRSYTLSQQMISYDIRRVIDQWRASSLIDVDEAKANELAKINELERTYWQAWRRSCEGAETIKQRGKPGNLPGKVQTENIERTVKEQAGDPRFLQGVQWCIEQRCKILGVNAPAQIELAGKGGGALPFVIIRENDDSPNTNGGSDPA